MFFLPSPDGCRAVLQVLTDPDAEHTKPDGGCLDLQERPSGAEKAHSGSGPVRSPEISGTGIIQGTVAGGVGGGGGGAVAGNFQTKAHHKNRVPLF